MSTERTEPDDGRDPNEAEHESELGFFDHRVMDELPAEMSLDEIKKCNAGLWEQRGDVDTEQQEA